jgi:signal transduction histidine kinase
MSMPRRSFWFSRPTTQAQIETLLVGAAIWLSIIFFQLSSHLTASGSNQWESSFDINLLCLSWFILRVTYPRRLISKASLQHLLSSFIILLPLQAFYTVFLYLLLSPITSPNNSLQFYLMLILAIAISLFWLLFFTAITYLLLFWHRFRQQSLRWSLIDAHIRVLFIIIGVIGAILTFSVIRSSALFLKIDFLLLSSFFFVFSLFILILLQLLFFLMPPLALFAYFATRPTIKRIETLLTATNKLRQGQYAVRAPIEGQDEVAQLQKNFNAMADELEKTIHDLQAERDHVAFLLNERRELFANVSHELRTPITTLRGYLESDLKNRAQMPVSALWEDMAVMEREVLQLQERADELFNLSKAEVEPVALQKAPCDIRQIVQTLVNGYAPLAWRTSKVEIVADMPEQVPMVTADAQRLEQALKNIVRNALRHTPPGGVIALIVTIEPERIAISIEDTGEGIAPEALEHIWERFYQAKTLHQQSGAGIGLSLVKEWITGMDGSVAATSTYGEGSCFTLYLPRLQRSVL